MTMLQTAAVWHVFVLSHSAFQMGLLGLVQFVPALLLMMLGGAVADTFDRRSVVMLAQIPPLAAGALLYFATVRGFVSVPLIFASMSVIAAAGAFDGPARMAFLPGLVGREAFPRAVVFATTTMALAFVTGPGVQGLLIALSGLHAVYALYGGLIGLALVFLSFLHPVAPAAAGGAMSVEAVRESLGFVRRSPVILGCMTLDMLAVIFGGAGTLLPIYAKDILGKGPRGYGLLAASLEMGALLMALFMLTRPPVLRAGRALLIAVGVYGAATIAFGLSRTFPLSVALYMIVGMADSVSVVMRSTAIQLSTPDELRGRVSAVNMLFIGASNRLGGAESGFVAALTNATFSVVSGGVGCLVVLAIVAARIPELRRYRIPSRG
jgi:MFS family permease